MVKNILEHITGDFYTGSAHLTQTIFNAHSGVKITISVRWELLKFQKFLLGGNKPIYKI